MIEDPYIPDDQLLQFRAPGGQRIAIRKKNISSFCEIEREEEV